MVLHNGAMPFICVKGHFVYKDNCCFCETNYRVGMKCPNVIMYYYNNILLNKHTLKNTMHKPEKNKYIIYKYIIFTLKLFTKTSIFSLILL